MYTNCDCVANSGVIDILLSDHDMIYITRKKEKNKYNRVHFLGRSYRNYVKEELRQHLENKDWTQYFDLLNPSECWQYLSNCIKEKVDEMCPLKHKTVRDKNEPWLSNEIMEAIHDKDKAWKKAKKTKDIQDIANAKLLGNEVKDMIRRAKANSVHAGLLRG